MMIRFMKEMLYLFNYSVELSANPFFYIQTFPSKKKLIKSFPSFNKETLLNWKTFFSQTPETPSSVLSQFLWHNIYILVYEDDVHISRFSQNNLNFVSQLFQINGSLKNWHLLINEYHLNNNCYFQQLQLINSIPEQQ